MLDILLTLVAVGLGGTASEGAEGAATGTANTGLVAEEQVATGRFLTALEVKPILTATKSSWIGVREWDGQDLVYVTHLWAWRCGLAQMEVSVNGGSFDVWPLPKCHDDTASPGAILETDGVPYRAFGLKTVNRIDVRITYDDLSVDEMQFPRTSVLIP